MKKTGRVISIDQHKGFIKNFDNTFYFNKNSFIENNDFNNVKNGDFLEFDIYSTDKGMRAKNI